MDKRSILFILCLSLAFFALQAWFAPKRSGEKKEAQQQEVPQSKPLSLPAGKEEEAFYVLETPYQQLVFSTRGGGLAEINFPFKGPDHPKSLVKEIRLDREIETASPQNAHFPLFPHHIITPEGPAFREKGTLGGYYPLLRRPLLDAAGQEKSHIPAEYYALATFEDGGQPLHYRVTRFEPNLIQFEAATSQGRRIKTFSIPEKRNGPYCFQLEIEGEGKGLWLSSGIPDVELVGGSYNPLLRLQVTRGKVSEVDTIDLPKKEPILATTVRLNWISNCNGFLGLILDPLKNGGEGYKAVQVEGLKAPTRLSLIDPHYRLYPPENFPGYVEFLPLKSGTSVFRIFAGPFDEALLKELDMLYDDPLQNYNPDYTSAQSIQGWFSFISRPFAKFLSFLIQIFYSVTRSWAAAIILLTIALRAMMYPLNAWSIRSSLKMQEISPKVKALQERYKKDPRKAQSEVLTLYREAGISPVTGCLPVLFQMPFLFGMFYLLKSSFPLRGAPFIPGWIDDLAAPDVLFSWGQPFWLIGNEFHLLPILMGATMYLQQRFTSKSSQSPTTDAQKQQKMMGNVMSILFTAMFYNFPSGLNLYFMFSTLLGILQQWWAMKKMHLSEK